MDKQKINRIAKEVKLKGKSNRAFILIHGYTGSPTDFNKLAIYLNKKFDADVFVPLLRGHGTKISDLDKLNYFDFFNQVEKLLLKLNKNDKNEVVLIGLSLGGLIAIDLASKYSVKGVVLISPVDKYKFPFNILNFIEPILIKKKWKKIIPPYEVPLRKDSFNYSYVHARGFKVVKQFKRRFKKKWKEFNVPIMIVQSDNDLLVNSKSVKNMIEKINSKKTKVLKFHAKKKTNHNLFYSPYNDKVCEKIVEFILNNSLFGK